MHSPPALFLPTSPIRRLSTQRRVMDWLFWWQPGEWEHSPFLHVLEDGAGAALAIPAGGDPLAPPAEGATFAWLRWCALADGASAVRVLRRLLDQIRARLVPLGVRDLWALTVSSDWMHPHMSALGFRLAEHIITFVRDASAALPSAASPAHLQPIAPRSELDRLLELDQAAFCPPWQLGRADLQRLLSAAPLSYGAWIGEEMVGYVCALRERFDEAHIVRLAVAPAWQRRGIGRALLVAAMRRLSERGASSLSLNTMASNLAAQALYAQLGFARERRRGFVWHMSLAEA